MLNKSITVGIKSSNIKEVKSKLEQLLNINFEEHESSYLGEYYLSKVLGVEEFELSNNFVDGGWSEPDHKDYSLILRYNSSKNLEQLTCEILKNMDNSIVINVLEIKAKEYLRVYDFVDEQFVLIREKFLK